MLVVSVDKLLGDILFESPSRATSTILEESQHEHINYTMCYSKEHPLVMTAQYPLQEHISAKGPGQEEPCLPWRGTNPISAVCDLACTRARLRALLAHFCPWWERTRNAIQLRPKVFLALARRYCMAIWGRLAVALLLLFTPTCLQAYRS